jgi:hypothetical protein
MTRSSLRRRGRFDDAPGVLLGRRQFIMVLGFNGENVIQARGKTPVEACWRACPEAAAIGMLRRAFS